MWLLILVLGISTLCVLHYFFTQSNVHTSIPSYNNVSVQWIKTSDIKTDSLEQPIKITKDSITWEFYNNRCDSQQKDPSCHLNVVTKDKNIVYVLHNLWPDDKLITRCPNLNTDICAIWIEKSIDNETKLSKIPILGPIANLYANIAVSLQSQKLIHNNNHFLFTWSEKQGLLNIVQPCSKPSYLNNIGLIKDMFIVECSTGDIFTLDK